MTIDLIFFVISKNYWSMTEKKTSLQPRNSSNCVDYPA